MAIAFSTSSCQNGQSRNALAAWYSDGRAGLRHESTSRTYLLCARTM